MANIRLYGSTSGYTEIASPDIGNNQTVTFPANGDIPGVTVSATVPADATTGDLWLNSSTQETSIYSGSAWIGISGTGRATSFFLGGM